MFFLLTMLFIFFGKTKWLFIMETHKHINPWKKKPSFQHNCNSSDYVVRTMFFFFCIVFKCLLLKFQLIIENPNDNQNSACFNKWKMKNEKKWFNYKVNIKFIIKRLCLIFIDWQFEFDCKMSENQLNYFHHFPLYLSHSF